MMTVDELAIVLLELAQTPRQDEWIARWQPELVDALVTVTQWALGRLPAGVVRRLPRGRWPEELSEAALLFVKRVCFATDGTYYQIFGLTPETVSPQEVRARYRALIRLTHPDVGVQGLPPDAAGMVNRAYAVLGSDTARRAYDEQLAAGERASAAAEAPGSSEPFVDGATADASDGRRTVAPETGMGERVLARWVMVNARWSRQLRMALIGAALMVPVVAFLFWSVSDRRGLDTIVALTPGPEEFLAPTATVPDLERERATGADHAGFSWRGPVDDPGPAAMESPASAQEHGFMPVDAPPRGTNGQDDDVMSRSGLRDEREVGSAPDDGRMRAAAKAVQMARGESGLPAEVFTATAAGVAQERGGEDAGEDLEGAGTAGSAVRAPVAQHAVGKQAAGPGPGLLLEPAQAERQVDWPAARRYLQDIGLALGDQAEVQSLNHYLERMQVKGSLLRPVMELYQRYGRLSAQYSTWSMAEGHGLFDAETTLTVRTAANDPNPIVRSFLLRAQFLATESGTRLDTLDLQSLE